MAKSALRAIDAAYSGANPNAIKEFLNRSAIKRKERKRVRAQRYRKGATAESAWKIFQGTPRYRQLLNQLTTIHHLDHRHAFTIAFALFEAGFKADKQWQEQPPAAGERPLKSQPPAPQDPY